MVLPFRFAEQHLLRMYKCWSNMWLNPSVSMLHTCRYSCLDYYYKNIWAFEFLIWPKMRRKTQTFMEKYFILFIDKYIKVAFTHRHIFSIMRKISVTESCVLAHRPPGLEFRIFCVWRSVSSDLSRHPQEVLPARCSLCAHKSALRVHSYINP